MLVLKIGNAIGGYQRFKNLADQHVNAPLQLEM